MNYRQLFLDHVGQTSEAPLALHITRAEACTMWDADDKPYLDLIGGISVCNVGHRHPKVVAAIKEQADKYLHIMVYGELVESPQVIYAKRLTALLPENLNSVFYTASGSEATETAMKIAKRYTGRSEIISFKKSYHGSTQGAMSVLGDADRQRAYRPLLPGIRQLNYNSLSDLEIISTQTACVIAETVQSEAGVIAPHPEWLLALRKRCTELGVLLVLDEIQCGFGRNGTLFAFMRYGVVPDILLLGKAMGAGMPIGAMITDRSVMSAFSTRPILGHMNTFGGHPVSCAAGLAGLQVLLEEKILDTVEERGERFEQLLKHPKILEVRRVGLMLAVQFESFEINKAVIDKLLLLGVFTDWFLFESAALRIVPPLIITDTDIQYACASILQALDEL